MMPDRGNLAGQIDTESGIDETRERILEAAAHVFAEQGYVRATTRTLADAAGVNEVTLFRHFGNKKNLFGAVVARFAGPAVSAELSALITGEYRQDLVTVGSHLLQILLERKDSLRLMLCEATHFPDVQAAMVENPRQLRRLLAEYFWQQIGQGRVRPLHPSVMAQAFLGMFFALAILQGFLAGSVEPELENEVLVAQFVDIFVDGTLSQE
jgi:AcrR family transcriptional regulator